MGISTSASRRILSQRFSCDGRPFSLEAISRTCWSLVKTREVGLGAWAEVRVGITFNTRPTDYRPIKQFILHCFDGQIWVPISDIINVTATN
jgi:hypothetical protein